MVLLILSNFLPYYKIQPLTFGQKTGLCDGSKRNVVSFVLASLCIESVDALPPLVLQLFCFSKNYTNENLVINQTLL